jgi:hypothetical protein
MDGRSYMVQSVVICAFRVIKCCCDQVQEGKALEYTAAERVKIAGFPDGTYSM